MLACQKTAIENYSDEIIEALEYHVELFFTHLQRRKAIKFELKQLIDGQQTNKSKLVVLLELLKTKDDGWKATLSYLRTNNYGSLADKLEQSASATSTYSTTKPENTETWMVDFKEKLVNHYKFTYSSVSSGCHKHVKDVWVPLRIEEKTQNPCQRARFDHLELLNRLVECPTSSMALVKGHPGVGKTTLVKKIAFDWATGAANQFSLVLTVPLRYVGETNDFLQLTVDYYANQLRLSPTDQIELLNHLKRLNRKLLICLDGLDEYEGLARSPFKILFKTLFNMFIPSFKRTPPPSFPYQLLITSRPYGCDLTGTNKWDFFPLRFQICSIDKSHLAEFVKFYCETEQGRENVMKYLQINAKLVIEVPLILTFICYLADVKEELPTNLSFLYERFLSHMIKREVESGKLTEKISIDGWKLSKIVKSTAFLAFEGCKYGKYEFPKSMQKTARVSNDCFTCGFLLLKYNFSEESLYGEFPHRSIQEFFAALHCFQFILTAIRTESNAVVKEVLSLYAQVGRLFSGFNSVVKESDLFLKEIYKENSQFGRFFFGISSADRKSFEEVLEWLNPTFCEAEMFSFNICSFLNNLSASLIDCSEAQRFGQRLAVSLDQLENQITTERKEKIGLDGLIFFHSFNKSFQCGLNLSFVHDIYDDYEESNCDVFEEQNKDELNKGDSDGDELEICEPDMEEPDSESSDSESTTDNDESFDYPSWFIPHVDNPEWSHLTHVTQLTNIRVLINLWKKFEKIDILIWRWATDNLTIWISSLDHLPPTSTLIIQTNGNVDCELNFRVEYDTISTPTFMASSALRHFTFRFHKFDTPNFEEIFSGHINTSLMIEEPEKPGEVAAIRWITVKVKRNLEQHHLVKTLMQLAVSLQPRS